MRFAATVLVALGLMALSTPSFAFWTSDIATEKARGTHYQYQHETTGHYAKAAPRRYAGRGWNSGSVSGVCWEAARKGGPCGCEASRIAFGEPIRELWLVSNWYRFPRTSAHVGAAAIWGRHHVEIVTAINGDGTVDTRGSVGFSHVPIGRLTFVEPSGTAASRTGRHRRYAGI